MNEKMVTIGGKMECYKSADGLTGLVSALGIRFSDHTTPDLQGDFFNNETYFGKRAGNGVDATLNHMLPIVTEDEKSNEFLASIADMTFKNAIKTEQNELGIVASHVLDLANEHENFVFELAEKGAFTWSSGATSHTARFAPVGDAHLVKRWDIGEFAYTPQPAEPRLPHITSMKSITYKPLDIVIGDKEHPDNETDNIKLDNSNGDNIMSEQKEDTIKSDEYLKSTNARLDGIELALQNVTDVLEKIPAKAADIIVTKDEADNKLEGNPFKTAGAFYTAVQKASEGRQYDDRLKPLKSEMAKEGVIFQLPTVAQKALKAATGLSEGVPADGGFLVGTDRQEGVLMRDYATGQVWNRAQSITIGANSNGTTINALKETSRATGSRWGGVVGYWLAEADEKTATKPKFRQLEPKLKKVAALLYSTDELLQDSTALASVINATVPQELMFQKDNAAFEGSGVGKPLGIMNSPALVTVAKEAGQAAATLVAENIINMRARRWARGQYVWFINQDVEPQLHQLNLPVGTGGALVYMPPGGLSANPYGTLYGDPVIPIEHCETLGTVGDIVQADMSQYITINKGGVQTAESIHVRFIYDESVFRFVERVDGMPVWDSALTPFKGTNTQSPFVALATRS